MAMRITLLLTLLGFISGAVAQPTAFTYQGRLLEGAAAAEGPYDLGFKLFDDAAGGTQQGPLLTKPAVAVSNGLFVVDLDFGTAALPGASRWLEISVLKTGSGGNPVLLMPRQPLQAVPYAVHALGVSTYAGPVADGQLSSNVALHGANQTFTGNVELASATGTFTGNFIGNGAGLTNLSTMGGGGAGVFTGRIANLPTSPNTMFGAVNGFSDTVSGESQVTTLSPGQEGLAKNLSVRLDTSPGTGNSITITLRVNGVDTAVGCSLNGSTTTASSGAATASVPAGAMISFKVQTTGVSAANAAMFGWILQ